MGELISIVVPAYNVESFLDKCLNSILKQTYSKIEVLLVDDGSKDKTLQTANRFHELYPDKIRVIHTENQGVTMARFTGIRASRGEWIGFVDADDELEPDMFERLYTNAKKYNADISHCGHKTIVNGGERIHEFYNTGRLLEQDRKSGVKDLFVGPVEPSLWTKLFRRSLVLGLLQDNVMDTSIKYNEDLLMNYYLFSRANKAVYEDFCGYHYMAQSSSATRSSFRIEKILNPVKVWEIILDSAEEEIKDIAWRKYLVACINAYSALSGMKEYGNEASGLRKNILTNRSGWSLLSRNERVKLSLILLSPGLYRRIYQFYEKHFQRKMYE